MTGSLLTIVVLIGVSIGGARGDEVDTPIHAKSPRDLAWLIDQNLERALTEDPRTELLGESAFLRRVTLDLAGRIPTAGELKRFRESESLHKREDLVRRLIHSPDYAFHQRNELDNLLLRRLTKNQGWRDYLLEATRENRAWNNLFREVMSPEDHRPEDVRPVAFLKQRVRDVDSMANDTSILWFGVNIGCAKCHDHPLVDDWKQSHYYGMASFFKRTFTTKKGHLGEHFDGDLQYQTIDGEKQQAEFMFLTGTTISEPEHSLDNEKLKEFQEAIKKAERESEAAAPPRPDFRPRSQLVDLALSDSQQRFFAKNIANRIWARMFGRGLIHPLDQMHSENPPSHPELLELLSRDLIENDYDLRRLLHAIALTDAYARALPPVTSGDEDLAEVSDSNSLEAAIPRALTPHQASLSLIIATTSPQRLQTMMESEAWASERESLENRSESVASKLEIPDQAFQVPVSEALWFSNNQQVENDYLNSGNDRLVGYLSQIESDHDLIVEATRAILTRDPIPEELVALTDYLEQRSDRRNDAIKHLVWALLSSPEFRFNH